MEFSSGLVRSGKVVSHRFQVLIRDPVKPMHFRKGTSCFSLKWDNDWSGRGDNHPVNPMHFSEGTSCFSLKWKKDWWDYEVISNRPVNPMHFREGTSCFGIGYNRTYY